MIIVLLLPEGYIVKETNTEIFVHEAIFLQTIHVRSFPTCLLQKQVVHQKLLLFFTHSAIKKQLVHPTQTDSAIVVSE